MESLIGVVVGGIIGIAGGIMTNGWIEWRRRKSFRAAFRADIENILKMSESRGHVEHFRKYLDLWRKGEQTDTWPTIVGYNSDKSSSLLSPSIEQLGMLGEDVSGDVAHFYSVLTGIETDLREIARGELNHLTTGDRIKLVEYDVGLWYDIYQLGQNLVKRL